jgi:cell division protein FtsQ
MATRMTRTPRPAATVALPGDVRLMNAVAIAVFVAAALALLAAALTWLSRSPAFELRRILIEGELHRVQVQALRALAVPRLAGNFFSTDLAQARAAFEAVPWVRRVVVRRVWPDRLVVQIEEHEAAALWSGGEREGVLVNRQGEVFNARLADVAHEALPSFAGPEGRSAAMLDLYRRLLPVLRRLDMEIEQLQLSARGSWRVLLDSGASLELGRGSEDELSDRTERFVRTLAQVTDRFPAPLEYADLRHVDGYAVRLRGVTTTAVVSGAKPRP